MLSENTKRFLEKSGYEVEQGEQVVAIKYRPKRSMVSIALVSTLLICFSFILLPNYPLFIGAVAAIILGLVLVLIRTSRKLIALIDFKEKSVLVPSRTKIRQWVSAADVQDIIVESKMRTEVNHPFKNMDEDFIISLSFQVVDRKSIPFLFFPSELQSASVSIKELREHLLSLIKAI